MKTALALVALGLTGCGTQMYQLPTVLSACPTGKPDESTPLHAAAVRVDITPPVGLSLAGHGLEARISTGLLTHLYCRGFVFEKEPERFAWLACELQGLPLVLQRRVAELVRASGAPFGADQIILSAVHTHAGPGHIYDSQAYTSELGGTRQAAYDQRVVDFLAGRIAGGISDAFKNHMVPAQVRTLTDEDESTNPCVVGLTRNRAVPAFARNKRDLVDRLLPCHDSSKGLEPGHRDVDRRLPIVYVEAKAKCGTPALPLGVMAVFATHGTAMPSSNDMYHGDVFSFASTYCEQVLPSALRARAHLALPEDAPFVCAIANGAEGDVSPDWSFQGEGEARYLGERLGAEITNGALSARAQPSSTRLESRYLELNFPGAAAGKDHLCDSAVLGTPAGGGAPDGPTRLRFWEQFNAGMINPGEGAACAKPRIGAILAGMDGTASKGWEFPVQAPMEWLRIGEASFLAVPLEPTTMVGLGLAEAVDEALFRDKDSSRRAKLDAENKPIPWTRNNRTHIVGLTNGYLSYAATEAEYEAQLYEGASTVYGRYTEAFLDERARALMSETSKHPCGDGPDVARDGESNGAKPPEGWERTGSQDPNAIVGGKPHVGEVGTLFMSPSPVHTRWPGDLSLQKACFDPQAPAEKGEPLHVSVGECCDDVTWNLVATWEDRQSLSLCGASVARVQHLINPDKFVNLAVALRPAELNRPSSKDPSSPPRCGAAGEAGCELAYPTGFDSLLAAEPPADPATAPASMLADDEHGLVVVRYDPEQERWQARFRDASSPRGASGAPGIGTSFRLQIHTSRGFVTTAAVVRHACASAPSCKPPAAEDAQ
jgi:neutral ceramidase